MSGIQDGTGTPPWRNATGEWVYPEMADVLEEVGLSTVDAYIKVRRRTIASWVMDRLLHGECVD